MRWASPTGSMRALDPAGVVLCQEVLGLRCRGGALDALARPVVVNSRGDRVGSGRAVA